MTRRNLKEVKINLKNLDRENFDNLITAFYELSEPETDEYTQKIKKLRESLYFNLGYIKLYVEKAEGLDVYEMPVSVIFDSGSEENC